MRLTLHADYAYRVLIYLGCFPNEIVSTREIASAYAIPLNHLNKVVRLLAQTGIIESRRGRSGGLHLAKSPSEIKLDEVFHAMHERQRLLLCMECRAPEAKKLEYCVLSEICNFKRILVKSLNAFIGVMGQSTLQDIISDRERALLSRRREIHKSVLNAIPTH